MVSFPQLIEYAICFLALYLTIFFLLIFLKNRDNITKVPKPREGWNPKLSVIVPAYNESGFIKKCIQSLLDSDHKNLEVIVVDDGSKDNTFEVASSINDPRLKVFRKENSGKANSMNFGIKKATGELIATMDSDSYISKDTITKMLPLFENDEIAAVTAAVKVMEKGKENNFWVQIQRVEYIFTLFSRKVFTFVDAVSVTPGPFSVFRSWVFTRVGYFNPKTILEDQEMALRIQEKNYKIRSSLDAEVFTEVPDNFLDLLSQRIRWHRGGLHNTLKYLNMVGPHYGDFGLVVMPMTIMAIVAILMVFLVAGGYYFVMASYSGTVDFFDISTWIRPINFILVCLAVLNFIWIFWGLSFFKSEKISAFKALLYVVAYSYLLTIFWIAVFVKELKFEKMSW
ncbi:MAG: glycosyltransferase family 2 protein [Candidatus Micrarchaeota archaeon]